MGFGFRGQCVVASAQITDTEGPAHCEAFVEYSSSASNNAGTCTNLQLVIHFCHEFLVTISNLLFQFVFFPSHETKSFGIEEKCTLTKEYRT